MDRLIDKISDQTISDKQLLKLIYRIDKKIVKHQDDKILHLFRVKLLRSSYSKIIEMKRFDLLEDLLKLYITRIPTVAAEVFDAIEVQVDSDICLKMFKRILKYVKLIKIELEI